jgi:hypothetical protein
MRIDESRHHDACTGIDNFCGASVLFDLIGRTDALDLPIADQHPAITNNPELRQLCADTPAMWSAQRHELRSVQDGE